MKNLILLCVISFWVTISYGQDTLVIKGSLSNVKIASLGLIAYNTKNTLETGGWKVFHQKVIDTERDSTFSFHIEYDPDYLYVILIEDFQQLIDLKANRIIYHLKKCVNVDIHIDYEESTDYTIDYIVTKGQKYSGYSIEKVKSYN